MTIQFLLESEDRELGMRASGWIRRKGAVSMQPGM
jgi:hypothetical protein